jgi:hypothetical protein
LGSGVVGAFALPLHLEDATDVLVERSFAGELARLVPASIVEVVNRVDGVAAADRVDGVAAADRVDGIEVVDGVELVDGPPQTGSADAPAMVRPVRGAYERVVPLTRTPLRHMACAITWPNLVDLPAGSTARSERHELLKRLDHESCPVLEAVLLSAYAEEDVAGRMLALRSLLRHRYSAARNVFVDALRVGSDEERSFAVDALVALGDRDALPPAFSDRVEAIAARAAFAFVASHSRADYAAALEPFVDRTRIEAIMALLAGVVQ